MVPTLGVKSKRRRGFRPGTLAIGILLACGCAATPYRYGRFHPDQPDGTDVQPIAVAYGEPNKFLDGVGWVVGAPARLITMNKNVNNHHISHETLEQLKLYLERNDITDVYVAIDVYDPKDQWRRLTDNDRIAPVWKYSFGTVNWIGYTLLPNRIIGGDRYNPFTNTLNLSSDVPALVLAEAAYAKDIRGQTYPGVYASIVNDTPVLGVVRQARAASDLLGYARVHDEWPVEKQAYHVLYPQMGVTAIGPIGTFVPVIGPYLDLAGAAAGHVAGRTAAAIRESTRFPSDPFNSLPPDGADAGLQLADSKADSPNSADEPDAVILVGFEQEEAEPPVSAAPVAR